MQGLPLKTRLAALLLAALLATLLAGCSGQPRLPRSSQADGDCQPLLQRMTQRIDAAAVADPQAYPVVGYRYLRFNRLLASYARQLASAAQFESWYQRLYQLGQQARQVELDNLSPPFPPESRRQIERCIEIQATRDRQSEGFQQRLTDRARPPELYRGWQRALGLFPLTRQIVLHQIDKQQRRWRRDFNQPALFDGVSRTYSPGRESRTPDDAAAWLQQARLDDPLGIPRLPAAQLQQLFDYHAPVWQVFNRSSADLIGSLYWRDGQPTVNSSDPVSYLLPSYTRFNGQPLLQLNYLVWFAARPPQQPLDLYAGRLDGLLWRVTLDSDGKVLLYDSIHPCGCYHQIFVVSKQLRLKPAAAGVEQPLILSGVAPERQAGRLLLQLTAQDHYLQGIRSFASPPTEVGDGGVGYRFSDYHRLRSLPAGGGRRNLFDADGLVGQSARLERFLLWPMGVVSPGAMRVWGAHAISFASRRYFDEAYLFEAFFEWDPESVTLQRTDLSE